MLVGEGNLSFAVSLAQKRGIDPKQITATVYESQQTSRAADNAAKLKTLGAAVLYGIDATRLRDSFGAALFDLIVFQFPHTGSRDSKWGRNSNHVLVRNFLRSARQQIPRSGKIAISSVVSPHYEGAFDFIGAAEFAKVYIDTIHPFIPSKFPPYTHEKTHETGNALRIAKSVKSDHRF